MLAAATLLATLSVHPVPARADFSKPRTLAEAPTRFAIPRFAVDGRGRTTFVWEARGRIESVRTDAKGRPGRVRTLSNTSRKARAPGVDVDERGVATVAWYDADRGLVEFRRLDAVGRRAGPVLFATDTRFVGWDVDPSGETTVLMRDLGRETLRAVRIDRSGQLGRVRTVVEGLESFDSFGVDRRGVTTIVWGTGASSGAGTVMALQLDSDGRPGATQIVSGEDRVLSPASLAVSSRGTATVAWKADAGGGQQSGRAVRLAADGTPGTIQTLFSQPAAAYPTCCGVGVDDQGRETFLFLWSSLPPPGPESVYAMRANADGSPGPIQTLPGWSHFAVSGEGRAVVTTINRPRGGDETVESIALSSDGSLGPVEVLSRPYPAISGGLLAMSPEGRATVAWTACRGQRNCRIQFAHE